MDTSRSGKGPQPVSSFCIAGQAREPGAGAADDWTVQDSWWHWLQPPGTPPVRWLTSRWYCRNGTAVNWPSWAWDTPVLAAGDLSSSQWAQRSKSDIITELLRIPIRTVSLTQPTLQMMADVNEQRNFIENQAPLINYRTLVGLSRCVAGSLGVRGIPSLPPDDRTAGCADNSNSSAGISRCWRSTGRKIRGAKLNSC